MERLFGFGSPPDLPLDALQMSCRAGLMFVLLLAMIRFGGARIFGKKSSFDNVVVILLGAIAARGVVGASPFGPTVAASAVIVVLHRVIAWLVVRFPILGRALKGQPVVLYQDGKVRHARLRSTTIGEDELMESLRLETRQAQLAAVDEARLETNGRISFLVKARGVEAEKEKQAAQAPAPSVPPVER
jgi:uncharacterized membrane protein YcaP (DUF421 family)